MRARLKSAPEDVPALQLLARASVRLGRDSVATALYQRLGSLAPTAEDLYLQGLVLSRSDKPRRAVATWEHARTLDPDHPETLLELTRAIAPAAASTTRSRSVPHWQLRHGWESRAEAMLGMIQLERNDPAGAAAYWLRALGRAEVVKDGVPRPIVPRKELAIAWLRAGRPGDARDQLRIVLAAKPDPEAYWLMSRAALQEGAWDEARSAFQKGSAYRDEHPEVFDPAPYVGSEPCAACHTAEFKSQQASRHARTFFRDAELGGLVLPASTVADRFDSRTTHALYRTADGRLRQETRRDRQVFDAVVQYAFGSGDRGLTLVGRDGKGKAYELRLSEYPDGSAATWDLTSGHPRNPGRPEEFLGQPLTEDAVRLCLSCHVTEPKAVLDRSGPCALDRGIGCEKCHGPGGNHLRAVEAKLVESDPSIGRPSMVAGARLVHICAQCHTPSNHEVSRDDPTSARFQSTTLTWSRCFTESNDSLDCATCHNPHRDASTSIPHYEARCLSCHSSQGSGPRSPQTGDSRPRRHALIPSSARTICPVNPVQGCIGCHMPAVKDIVPHSSFTDHFIRVHRD